MTDLANHSNQTIVNIPGTFPNKNKMILIKRNKESLESNNLEIIAKFIVKAKTRDNSKDLLNDGNQVVFMDYYDNSNFNEGLPRDRVGLEIKTPEQVDFKTLTELFSHFILHSAQNLQFVKDLEACCPNAIFYVGDADKSNYKNLLKEGVNLVVEESILESDGQFDYTFFTELFMVNAVTDRQDGLYPTVVVDELGIGLGLCYSSLKSIEEALRSKMGVYHSRKRVQRKKIISGIVEKGRDFGGNSRIITDRFGLR